MDRPLIAAGLAFAAPACRPADPPPAGPTGQSAFVRVATARWGGGPDAQSGGASAFLRFIREELKPYVDSTIPRRSGRCHARRSLVRRPLCHRRVAAPFGHLSAVRHRRVSFEFEKAYPAANRDLPARVFVAAGALETAEEFRRDASQVPETTRGAIVEWEPTMGAPRMVELLGPCERALTGRRYPGLSLTTHIDPGATHTSVLPGSIARGLRVVFGTYSGG